MLVLWPLAVFPALYADDVVEAPQTDPDQRIFGVIPNFQTVSNPDAPFKPLTVKGKWNLFVKETVDPFTGFSALFGAAFSQMGNGDPKYGNGGVAYVKRSGAAMVDFTTQNLFSAFVLASVLHQDPRYYRMGPRKRLLTRTGYSISRLVVARMDSGKTTFNYSGVFGMGLGIAASNLYYPAGSRNGAVMRSRIGSSFFGGAVGNIMSEFWPDIRTRFLSRFGPWKKNPEPPAAQSD